MSGIEERVALLEGRVQELREVRAELLTEIRQLRDEMNRRFEAIDRRFDGAERRFTWLVGMMVTGFLAVIGTVAGGFWGLLQAIR